MPLLRFALYWLLTSFVGIRECPSPGPNEGPSFYAPIRRHTALQLFNSFLTTPSTAFDGRFTADIASYINRGTPTLESCGNFPNSPRQAGPSSVRSTRRMHASFRNPAMFISTAYILSPVLMHWGSSMGIQPIESSRRRTDAVVPIQFQVHPYQILRIFIWSPSHIKGIFRMYRNGRK